MYEEPPFQQREKMYALQREKLRGDSSEVDVGRRRNEDDDHKDDGPRFNALCRGEELRVRVASVTHVVGPRKGKKMHA